MVKRIICYNKVVLRYIAIALFVVVTSYNLVLLLLKTNIKKDDVLLYQNEALIQQKIQENNFTKLQTDTLEEKIKIKIDKKKITLSDVAAKFITSGTYVDWFRDVCIWKAMYNLKWHPLFPNITFHNTITKSLSDQSLIQEGYARRARGYIITNITSSFDLLVRSRDGIELTILATGVTLDNVEQLTAGNVKYKELLHVSIDEDDIKKQEETARHCYLFKKESRIILNKLEIYYFEILQGAQNYGEMSIEWRSDHNHDFKVIDENNLFRLKPVYHSKIKYPVFKRNDRPVVRHIPNIDEQRRLDFPNIPKLNSNIAEIKDKCEKFGRQAKSLSYRYEGLGNIDNFLVYPKEHYEFTSGAKEETLMFNKDQASNIAMKTFAKLKDVQEK